MSGIAIALERNERQVNELREADNDEMHEPAIVLQLEPISFGRLHATLPGQMSVRWRLIGPYSAPVIVND